MLSRRRLESIIIGGAIKVQVVDIRGGEKVRLGIEAPEVIAVDREEVHQAKIRDRVIDASASLVGASADGALAFFAAHGIGGMWAEIVRLRALAGETPKGADPHA